MAPLDPVAVMSKKPATVRNAIAASVVVLALMVIAGVRLYRLKLPYGSRICAMRCVASALRAYADDHDGWFPSDAEDPVRALTALTNYLCPAAMAGLSGNIEETERRVLGGQPVTGRESSWVYQTGLRRDDPEELALLWDRQGGVDISGWRMRAGDHYVLFVNTETKLIRREEWPSFTNRQATLRLEVLAERKSKEAGAGSTDSQRQGR